MERLKELLKDVDQSVRVFYSNAIDLHNDRQLRSLAGNPIQIVDPSPFIDNSLHYGSKGFYVTMPECIERGDMYSGGEYKYHDYRFDHPDGVLVAKTHEGTQEMLHLFPDISLGTLEDKLVEGIQKSKLLQCAERGEGR